MPTPLELMLFDAVNLLHALDEGDHLEAQFLAGQIGERAWSIRNPSLGAAAMNVEVAIRDRARDPQRGHEEPLAALLGELEQVLAPLRKQQGRFHAADGPQEDA